MLRLWASGSSTGATAVTEPVEVPQEVDISTQVRKAMSGMRPVFRSNLATSQMRASMSPLCLSSWASMPAKMNAIAIVPNMEFCRPLSVTAP